MKIVITEYLEKVIDVEADDITTATTALRIANDRINSGEVELTAEDFTGRDIRRWNN